MFLIQIPLTVIITLLGKEKGKTKNCRITEACGAEITFPPILDITDCNFELKGLLLKLSYKSGVFN